MNWIEDVKEGMAGLDLTPINLRKFGLVVGPIFVLLAVWIRWKHASIHAAFIFGGMGAFLLILGGFAPNALKNIYRVWMGFALAVGWIVSRVLLILLFYLVITPIGIGLKILRKSLMPLQIREDQKSYWVHIPSKRVDYTRMF